MIRALALLACGVIACSDNVRIGAAFDANPSDGSVDGNGNPFTAGSYSLAYVGSPVVECTGTLMGSEADFSSITVATVGFVNGTVALAAPSATTLAISGTPIDSGWNLSEVDLLPDQPGAPPGIWEAQTGAPSGSGPDSTSRIVNLLGADSSTASSPGGIEGEAGTAYTTADTMGTCTITFGATLTKQ